MVQKLQITSSFSNLRFLSKWIMRTFPGFEYFSRKNLFEVLTYQTFKENRLKNRWPTNQNMFQNQIYPKKVVCHRCVKLLRLTDDSWHGLHQLKNDKIFDDDILCQRCVKLPHCSVRGVRRFERTKEWMWLLITIVGAQGI